MGRHADIRYEAIIRKTGSKGPRAYGRKPDGSAKYPCTDYQQAEMLVAVAGLEIRKGWETVVLTLQGKKEIARNTRRYLQHGPYLNKDGERAI